MDALAANLVVQIVLNGQQFATGALTLRDLVEGQALGGVKVATALNGHFVPEAQRATTRLNPGDKVEIVSARQGG